MNLRMACLDDGPALLEIYKSYMDTTITFEYEPPDLEEFRNRIAHVLEVYPYLVLEGDGKVLGYAYAHRFAQRAAYDWSAELSIYLSRDVRGGGLGRRLYEAMIALLRLQNVHTVYALVTNPNPGSEKFHEKMGFRLTGVQQNVGYKNGSWLGVSVYEKPIASYDGAPEPIVPVGQLSQEKISAVLKEFCS